MRSSCLAKKVGRKLVSPVWLITTVMALTFLVFPQCLLAAEDDTSPPEIVSINVAPVSIDVTSGPATVTVTLRITDNLSGFDEGYIELWSPTYKNEYQGGRKGRWFYPDDRVSGTALDGIYELNFEFQQSSEAGDWSVSWLRLHDKTRNSQYYNDTNLSGLGTTTVAVTSVPDTTSPVITSIEISPAAIDVSSGDVNITLTITVEDDLAGLNYLELEFVSPSYNQDRWLWIDEYYRISGDAFAGIYQTTVTFPQYSEAGDWMISWVWIEDKADNQWRHDEQSLTDMGLPITMRSFTIISDPQDLQPTIPVAIDISPAVVNTIEGPDTATFTLHLTDNLSGFDWGDMRVFSPSGQWHWIWFSAHYLTSGDMLDGVYQHNKEFPQYSEFGEWKIDYMYLYDRTYNHVYYETQDLEALGLTTTFEMEGVISGTGNTVGPEGGTVETESGSLTAEFPENALSVETEITITEIGRVEPVEIKVSDRAGMGTTMAEYVFGPDGLDFSEPVTITMIVDVTDLNQNERNILKVFQYNDDMGYFEPLPEEEVISIETTFNPDGTVVMTFVFLLEHFSTYAVILLIEDGEVDTTPPDVQITVPHEYDVVQNGVTLTAEVIDESSVDSVFFSIRVPNGNGGMIIGYEDIPATHKADTDLWELVFDSQMLLDGQYMLLARAVDEYGNEGRSDGVHFSIRNLAVTELLPASKSYRAGRTMPIKFTLQVHPSVNPNTPFVRNEELEIIIYETSDPDTILQSSLFGETSTDYRINSDTELYITNFKTSKTPAEYTVEIWNTANDFLLSSFTFETMRK